MFCEPASIPSLRNSLCVPDAVVDIIDLRETRDRSLLEQVYRELYLACFVDPDEQEDLQQYCDRLFGPLKPQPQPVTHFLVAGERLNDPAARVLDGMMIFELYRESGCGLLTYLAVAPHTRGKGLGRRLLRSAIAILSRECQGGLRAIFAETHNPEMIDAAQDTMSPHARIEIMQRLGARHVPVTYVQPELRPGDGRSYKLLLITFPIVPDQPHVVPAEVLLSFLDEFYRALGVAAPQLDTDYLAIKSEVGKFSVADAMPDGTSPTLRLIPIVPLPGTVVIKEAGVKLTAARYQINDSSFGLVTGWKVTTGPFVSDRLRSALVALHLLAKEVAPPSSELSGVFAILEIRQEGGKQSLSLVAGPNATTPLSCSMDDLATLGAKVVPLHEAPTPVGNVTARYLLSFTAASPRAGRIEINADFSQFLTAIQNRFGSVLSTDLIATPRAAEKTLAIWIRDWPNKTGVGLPHCGLAWKANGANAATNPFESFEYDLAARIFCGATESRLAFADQPNPDLDLESPELRFTECGIALHFVSDFQGSADGVRMHAFHSEPLSFNNAKFLIEFEIPAVFHYEAEGTDKALVSEHGSPRRIRFNAHLSSTIVAGLREVLHLVINPELRQLAETTRDGSLTAYDIIKLSKLWAGGERPRFMKSASSQLRFRADVSQSDWIDSQLTSYDDLGGIINAYLKHHVRDSSPKALALVGGTIQILLGDDQAGQTVFREIVAIASDDELPTPAHERPPAISRALLEMAGIKTSILDFEYVDALEIDETFRHSIMPNEEAFFLGLHKGTLVHFSVNDRAYREAKANIGISPYLLFPHAVLLHNEQCLLEAKAAAEGTFGEQEIGTLRSAELKIREKVQQHMQPNVFEYATEQAIYTFGHRARGLDKLREALDDQLEGINGRLEEEADKKKYGSEVFFVLAGLLIGMGQFVAGWEALNKLFFDPSSAAPADLADDQVWRRYFFQVVSLTLLLTLIWFGVATWRNLRALHGQRDAISGRATYLLAVLIVAFGFAVLLAVLVNIANWCCHLVGAGAVDEWVVALLILSCLSIFLMIERASSDPVQRKGIIANGVEWLANALGRWA